MLYGSIHDNDVEEQDTVMSYIRSAMNYTQLR